MSAPSSTASRRSDPGLGEDRSAKRMRGSGGPSQGTNALSASEGLEAFGFDGSAALIRAGQSGQAQRTLRYYAADGRERPLPFTCRIGPGPKAGVMVESCEGNGVSFQNNYMVSGGAITVSRQWGGPGLGYLTIQTLRP